jgi:hypothetical protein
MSLQSTGSAALQDVSLTRLDALESTVPVASYSNYLSVVLGEGVSRVLQTLLFPELVFRTEELIVIAFVSSAFAPL